MDYGLVGMRMDRRVQKELTRMGNRMDYRLSGGIMDKRDGKELTRMMN
jgi:hypothetical protein